jgi:oligoendopeptidase F
MFIAHFWVTPHSLLCNAEVNTSLLAEMNMKMDATQAKMGSNQEKVEARMAKFEEKMDDYHKKRMAMLDAHYKSTMAFLGQTEAKTEKTVSDPEMMQSAVEHQEFPMGEAIVRPVRGPRKRHTVQKLAAERRHKPKDRTREIHVSRRKVSHHARVAWQKRSITGKIRIQVNSELSKEFAADRMRNSPG